MSRLGIAGSAIKDCFASARLWLLQFFANIILFGLFAAWLLIPVSSNIHLIFNFLLAALLLAGGFMLHAGTLNFFADRQRGVTARIWPACLRAVKHLAALAVCVAVLALLWLLTSKLESYQPNFPPYIRSLLPALLRRHITLPTLDTLFSCATFTFRWILVPGLLFPFLLSSADNGFRGFRRDGLSAWKRSVLSYPYWLVLAASALLGVYATQALMAWKPDFKTSTFTSEAFSLAVRLFFAYLFGLFAWILACSSVGRHAAGGTPANISGNPGA